MKKYKKIIMLVEDDDFMAEETRTMLESFLEYNNYGFIRARNGLQALIYYRQNKRWLGFKQNRIKCILLDLRMPQMDGVQFIKELRRIEKGNLFAQFIPVVFLSAWEDEEKWQEAISSFACEYIKKPFTIEKLKNTLFSILHNMNAEGLERETGKRAMEKLIEYDEEAKKETSEP